jgi:citrate lyase subunit beta/citryl-CoA lyase
VRISAATPEADLSAAVWPEMSAVYLPSAESPERIHEADLLISHLEKVRGIRPGTVEIRPLVETAKGVTLAREVAASSSRIRAFGVGPNIHIELDGVALNYARAECELAARATGLSPRDVEKVLD